MVKQWALKFLFSDCQLNFSKSQEVSMPLAIIVKSYYKKFGKGGGKKCPLVKIGLRQPSTQAKTFHARYSFTVKKSVLFVAVATCCFPRF